MKTPNFSLALCEKCHRAYYLWIIKTITTLHGPLMEEMCVVVWVLSVWWLWFCISSSERKCKLSLNTAIKMEGRREGGALGLRTLICFSKHRTSTLSDAPLSRCRLPSSEEFLLDSFQC